MTSVTSGGWSLLYSPLPGVPKLCNLTSDPGQSTNAIERKMDLATELHEKRIYFMRKTGCLSAF